MIALLSLRFIRKKPHKWGVQAWFLAESRTGYCYNLDIYSGIEADTVNNNNKRKFIYRPIEQVICNGALQ